MKRSLTLLLLIVACISGCAISASGSASGSATPIPTIEQFKNRTVRHYPQLYLRGSFTRWAIEEDYRLEAIEPGLFAAAASLQQGKSYEWMFSAKDPSISGANCGYFKVTEQRLLLAQKVRASCRNRVLENFIFIPETTGVFEFFIDFSVQHMPRVYVRRVH